MYTVISAVLYHYVESYICNESRTVIKSLECNSSQHPWTNQQGKGLF